MTAVVIWAAWTRPTSYTMIQYMQRCIVLLISYPCQYNEPIIPIEPMRFPPFCP